MGRPRSAALEAAIIDIKNGMSINSAVKKHGAPVASIYRLVHAGEIIPHKNEKEWDRNIMKKCSKCKNILDISEFYKRDCYCKSCRWDYRNPQTGKGYELDKFLQRILCMRWKRI